LGGVVFAMRPGAVLGDASWNTLPCAPSNAWNVRDITAISRSVTGFSRGRVLVVWGAEVYVRMRTVFDFISHSGALRRADTCSILVSSNGQTAHTP